MKTAYIVGFEYGDGYTGSCPEPWAIFLDEEDAKLLELYLEEAHEKLFASDLESSDLIFKGHTFTLVKAQLSSNTTTWLREVPLL